MIMTSCMPADDVVADSVWMSRLHRGGDTGTSGNQAARLEF